jgi:ATP-dependent DNA helicase DinG
MGTLPPTHTKLSPQDLGLPPKFSRWRTGQLEAVTFGLDALSIPANKFLAVNAPTGAGKSGIAIALANALGGRSVVCTSTKPLQQQYLDDFAEGGMVDIRGRSNYLCHLGNGITCEDGYDEGCRENNTGCCPYRAAYTDALHSSLVLTNYAYWIAVHRYAEGLGEVDLLILDEAHVAFDEICSALRIEFHERDIAFLLGARFPCPGDSAQSLSEWQEWAALLDPIAMRAQTSAEDRAAEAGQPPAMLHRVRRIKALRRSLSELMRARGEWVFSHRHQGGGELWQVAPVWARDHAPSTLFRHARKVLLISATVTRRTMSLLGLEPDRYTYLEMPSQFPPASSPVYFIPTAAMSHNMSAENETAMYSRIDEIVAAMGPRKGIVHTVSYARAKAVATASRHSGSMIVHDRGGEGVQAGIEMFRAATGPSVLVSPALTQGFDFAGEACEYQILVKLPFPDQSDPVCRARTAADIRRPSTDADRERKALGTDYLDYAVSQVVIQSCGRAMRSAQDRCMTFILDNQWRWWHWRAEKNGCFPFWFRRLLKQSNRIPIPLPRVDTAMRNAQGRPKGY